MEKNIVYNQDCIVGMKKLEDNCIATCITDPPYNYEFAGQHWDEKEIKRRIEHAKSTTGSKTLVTNMPYGSGLAGGKRNERWYKKNRQNIIEYSNWVESWGTELYRIMKPGGLVLVFNSTRTIAQVQVALEKCGFYARDILVWKKNSGIPKGNNISKKMKQLGDEEWIEWEGWHSCLRNEWEAICVVQKPLINNYYETVKEYGVGLFYTQFNNGFQSNILDDINNKEKKDEYNTHITVKPLNLMEKLIKMTTPKNDNNIILDPFMGSGSTAVAAKRLGYNFIGYEISSEYMDIINKRLEEVNKNDN